MDLSASTTIHRRVGIPLSYLCDTRNCRGLASPSVDDSIIGQSVVFGRAATKLRSIETHL